MYAAAKWSEEYGEDVTKKSNKKGEATGKSNESKKSDHEELSAAITTLSQVASANELKSFAERKKKEYDFWGQPRLIARSIYSRLGHVNLKNIPDNMITPVTYFIRKDDNNIEPSDRVRIVQVWEDYLFLLVTTNSGRGKGVDRKSPVDWEMFYQYAVEQYKQLLSTMKEEQALQKQGQFKAESAMEFISMVILRATYLYM